MRDRELASPDASGLALDLDLGDDRDDGAAALRIGDALAAQQLTGALAWRGRPGLPAGFLRRRLDHRLVARRGQVLQAELDRVGAGGERDLVDELLAGELDLQSDRIAQVRGAQR